MDQQQKPYIILISADGFRYDLAEKYGPEFPLIATILELYNDSNIDGNLKVLQCILK